MRSSERSIVRSPAAFLVAATLITLLGAAVRILYAGHDSLWFDEVLTLNTAVQGVAAAGEVRDHPPLLYWLATLALRLFPAHEVSLRLPSLLAGILTIPLLINSGKAVALPGAGLWAGFLLAISPFHVRYSQEARHYALLLFFALLSLLFLYRALSGARRKDWLAYGAATAIMLAVHYSAWLLFAAQGVLVLGWLVVKLRHRQLQSVIPMWPAAVFLLPALLLLLPGALAAIEANAGASPAAGTTPAANLGTWLGNVWLAFGLDNALLAGVLLLLALAGAAILAARRRWRLLLSAVVIGLVPLALIQILAVARWALPKYVIYLLPLYLLAAGVSLQALSSGLARAAPWPGRASIRRLGVALLIAGVLLSLAWPRLQAEYQWMVRDWRGAIAALGAPAGREVVVALAQDTPDGFNAGGVVAPHYLPGGYQLLDGNHLDLDAAEELSGVEGRLSALLLNMVQPAATADEAWEVSAYQGPLYVLRYRGEQADLGQQLLLLYQKAAPAALKPAPQCVLQGKVAMMHLAREDALAAEQALREAGEPCPQGSGERAALQMAVAQRLLENPEDAQQVRKGRALAGELLRANPNDKEALALLTAVDLLQQFETGAAIVQEETAENPLQKRRFTMPQDGDWEDVLFMHPPASVSFTIDVPRDGAALRLRAALAPESWAWGGDGVTFVVTAQSPQSGVAEIYRQHVSNHEADRRWHTAELSLDSYAGESIALTLATETGPAGDGTGDWAGWGRPRILRRSGTE